MGPGWKRRGKGVKTKDELSLGDLVLAKVKGFPAWPAKISRPEDWKHPPDPRKYFVQFFGTQEIAFVSPADIQAFTSESKTKLSARCQGKTFKCFSQAVKEICEEYEELERKNLSGKRDNNAQNPASLTHSVDSLGDEALEVSGDNGNGSDELDCKLEIKGLNGLVPDCSPHRLDEVESQDVKPCLSDAMNHSLSPHPSLVKRNKLSTNPNNLVKRSVLGSSPTCHTRDEGSRDVKVECPYLDGNQSALTNGHQTKLAMGHKRKHDNAMHRNSDSVVSREHIGDDLQIKHCLRGDMNVSSINISRSDLDIGSGRKGKKLLKEKKNSEAVDDGQMDAKVTFEDHTEVISRKKMKILHDHENQTPRTNKVSFPSKMDNFGPKRLTSSGKAENQPLKAQPNSDFSTDEADLPPIKRQYHALGAVSSSTFISEKRSGDSGSNKNGLVHPNKVSPTMQPPTKRKAVRLSDDDDDELPKTPIHVGFASKVSVIPCVTDSKKKNVKHEESYVNEQIIMRNLGRVKDKLKEHVHCSRASRAPDRASPPTAQQGVKKKTTESPAEHESPSLSKLGTENIPFVEAKPVIVSPKISPHSLTEPQRQHFSKVPGSISPKKVLSGANRGFTTTSDWLTSSLNQSISERNKPISFGEKRKTTPKSDSQINDPLLLLGNPDESITSFGERMDVGRNTKTSFPVDLTVSDSGMSMKHLIAAAQARKKQANLQNSYGNPLRWIPDTDMLGSLAVESSNSVQLDVQGHSTSPSHDAHQFSSVNEHENEDLEERKMSSCHPATGSSLSGETEAAVAREAFEGMIETLSRTKESIGRATRLAIDCAKYGIANEVVEILIRKLENEPSFHRKVDIFFLVDSITQCSHSQKGIAGASYIPTVQAALPRLVGAAAPSGIGAQENRRQCQKVLRLWLERKILPESILRPYINDIGAINDGSSAGFSQRHPSRAERAIDDPIREMEGFLVDEYGSNATFQLPGFLSSHLFEEEEEDDENSPTKLCMEGIDTSPSKHIPPSKDSENYTLTPSDRRHCILEEVDGELEMEDVSGHLKDEKQLIVNDTSVVALLEPNSHVTFVSASNTSELLSSPEGSPPLPPGSPPVTPPLPTSPCPLSPPPPPLPLSSPSPPPPPPPSSSLHHPFPLPPVDPPLCSQSLPPQPALMSQHMPPLPPMMSTSRPLSYHPPPLHNEFGSRPTGNQPAHMVSNAQGSHIGTPVSGEVFSQQSSFFPLAGVSNAREHVNYNSLRPVEYGADDACMNPQALQQRQQFLPGGAHFAQRPFCPEPPPQQMPSHFSYPNSVQQHPYRPYSLPNHPDSSRRYIIDEQWRMPANDYKADRPRAGWMSGGCFGQPPDRAPASAVNFQPSAANNSLSAALIPVHGVPMMPSRPDVPAVNWRPA